MRRLTLSLALFVSLPPAARAQIISSSCPDPCLSPPKTSIAVAEVAPVNFGSTNSLAATMAPGRKKTLRIVTAHVTLQNTVVDSNTTVYLRCSSNYHLQGEDFAQASCVPGSYCGGHFSGVIDMDDATNLAALGVKEPMTVVCSADYNPPPTPGTSSSVAITLTESKK
jgi:hypothetical protein